MLICSYAHMLLSSYFSFCVGGGRTVVFFIFSVGPVGSSCCILLRARKNTHSSSLTSRHAIPMAALEENLAERGGMPCAMSDQKRQHLRPPLRGIELGLFEVMGVRCESENYRNMATDGREVFSWLADTILVRRLLVAREHIKKGRPRLKSPTCLYRSRGVMGPFCVGDCATDCSRMVRAGTLSYLINQLGGKVAPSKK